jgi:lysophospholipase L1-like esterase
LKRKSLNLKALLVNLSLALVSFISPFAIGEAYLRFVGYEGLRGLDEGRKTVIQPSSNPDIGYELVPGAKAYVWDANVEINASGYRGPISTPGKHSGYRVIAIGDSITFGELLPVESTYPYQLREILKERAAGYDVINFGVSGYDTLQEVSHLEHRGVVYKPDLVVVGFCLNDVGVASKNLEYITLTQRFHASLIYRLRLARLIANRIDWIRIGRWMNEKNQPDTFLRDYKSRIAPIAKEEHILRGLMQASPEVYPSVWYKNEHRIGRLRYSFERLSDLAERELFSVVVVIFPRLIEESGDYPHKIPHKIVTMEAKRVGFDVLDVTHDFMNIGMRDLRIKETDHVHPSAVGHRVVAEQLVRYIEEQRGG